MARKFKNQTTKGQAKWFKALFMVSLAGFSFIVITYFFEPEIYKRLDGKQGANAGSITEGVDSLGIETEEEMLPVAPRGKLHKDYLLVHQMAANRSGVVVIKNEKELDSLVAQNKLELVEAGVGYTLEDMTHSYTYLTPDAKRTLEKIALSFYTYSGDSSTITITSLTRTEETQKKLSKYNRNATKKESTHTRGVSFDISYIRYNGQKDWNYELTQILEGILAAMQADDEIYVIKERKQNCFHITVKK